MGAGDALCARLCIGDTNSSGIDRDGTGVCRRVRFLAVKSLS